MKERAAEDVPRGPFALLHGENKTGFVQFSVVQREASLTDLADFAVVFCPVDASGFLILLLVQDLAVGLGEMAIVLRAHATLFFVDTGLLMFQSRGFAGSELTALDALADALLLIDLALVDVVVVLTGVEVACAKTAAGARVRAAMRASLVTFMMALL